MSAADLNDATLRDRAVSAAQGEVPFDLLLCGGTVVDVITGELRRADIGCIGPMIASVHSTGHFKNAAQVSDLDGLFLSPGLIDSHMHIESSMITPATYAATVLPRGTTTVVWDPHELANVAGLEGIGYALDAAAKTGLRILTLAPSCVPSATGYETSGADFTSTEISNLLSKNEIHGLAEVMDMAAVTMRAPRMRAILQAALASGKPLNGHARSLSGPALQAYGASGISSDHEITSGADLLEKLRAGLWIELRSSHAHLLPEFVDALQGLPIFPSTITLCTDDIFPDDLLAHGGMDHHLRSLVALGLDPIHALTAATKNAATRLNRPDLAALAPGRRADIVAFENLREFRAVHVIRDGAVFAAPARAPSETAPGPLAIKPTIPRQFTFPAQGPRARIATIDKPRFTQWGEMEVPVQNGALVLPAEATRIAVLHRHRGAMGLGILRGWGAWRGAFATTVSHDCHNLTVFGQDPGDMALAANTLIEAGGGMAAVQNGHVLALLPLPVMGLLSDRPLAEVAGQFAEIRAAMDRIVTWEPPYLVFKALVGATLACNAGPHQTDMGIADPLAGKLLRNPILAEGLG